MLMERTTATPVYGFNLRDPPAYNSRSRCIKFTACRVTTTHQSSKL